MKNVEIELHKAQLKGIADRIFKLAQQLKQISGHSPNLMFEISYLGKRGEELNTQLSKLISDSTKDK